MLSLTYKFRNGLRDRYAVYMLTVEKYPLYLGLCRLTELFETPDAHRSEHVVGATKQPQWENVELELLFIANDEPSAKTFFDMIVASKGLPCGNSMTGRDTLIDPKTMNVECIETGEIWSSAYQCANAIGAQSAQLSRHLRRQHSYKSVKGYTFRYTHDAPRPAQVPLAQPHFKPGPAPIPHAPAVPQATPATPAPTAPADDPDGIPRARNPDGSLMYPHITDEQLRNFKRHIEPPVWEDFQPGSMEDI